MVKLSTPYRIRGVLRELAQKDQNAWLTTDDLIEEVRNSDPLVSFCYETVSRALRAMRQRGEVVNQFSETARRSKEWKLNTAYQAPTKKVPVSNTSSGSIVRATLASAVKEIVELAMSSKTQFSAYDITTGLRKLVKAGTVNVDPNEVGTMTIGGKATPRIDHAAVRLLVHDMYDTGKMPGYSRVHSVDHMVYAPDPAPVAASTSSSGDDPYDGSSTI